MESGAQQRYWFWGTLVLSCITVVAFVFAIWEVVEYRFFRDANYLTLHYLYITRGIASSLVLALWAAWYVVRQQRQSERELRQSRERYRTLLDLSPGAVALYDASLRVLEWNAAAERLYGFGKSDVLGRLLPTVPPERQEELERFQSRVAAGHAVMDVETLRRDRGGAAFEVQLSLLPFREPGGPLCYFEFSFDIRERVRLRESLLEFEKLTTMGRMAAGTAHHLNTPLAAMLLRVQMMRDRTSAERRATDMDALEAGIASCRHFVQRLLDFARRPPASKQAEEISPAVESVVQFLSPSLQSKSAGVTLDLGEAAGYRVLADRNQIEALISILLSNAMDAIPEGGSIHVCCRPARDGYVELRVSDSGCGIAAADLGRIFEPFFTTKGPGQGTGLGLAIARNIVAEHGGTLAMESEPHVRTTALVRLPLAATPAPQPAPQKAALKEVLQ